MDEIENGSVQTQQQQQEGQQQQCGNEEEEEEVYESKEDIVFHFFHGPFAKLEANMLTKPSEVHDKGFALSISPKVLHSFLEFLRDDTKKDVKFSHQLTKLQRKDLHILCEALDLQHKSIGSGKLRYIYVQKPKFMFREYPGLVDLLPPEILTKIFLYLDYRSLLRVGATCYLLNELSCFPKFWEILLCEAYPIMYNNIKQNSLCDWKQLFILRSQKKQEWESKKTGKLKEKNSNPIEGSSNARTKICKRCGLRFQPHSNNEGSCQYHSGIFLHLPTCTNKEAHKLLAKKNKKKSPHFLPNDPQFSGFEDCDYRYVCCGAKSINERGCTKGRHY